MDPGAAPLTRLVRDDGIEAGKSGQNGPPGPLFAQERADSQRKG